MDHELISGPTVYRPFLPSENYGLCIGITAYLFKDHLKHYPSALKGLQEGGNILHQQSEPIALIHEQVFRGGDKTIEEFRLYESTLQPWHWKDSPQGRPLMDGRICGLEQFNEAATSS